MPSPGLQSFIGSWYSVIAYGASGTGNTNDTTAIQAAMTAANGNGGGTVVVPAGTYRLDSSLSWTGLTNVCLWLGTGASFTGVGTVTAASGTNNSIFDQRTSGGGGTVTSVSGTSPISVATGTTTPAISFDGTAALSQSNTITGTAVGASGLTGAANPVRIVGRNASGTPASGTFAVGDVVINTDGTEYVCTVAGTPGTWVALNPGYGTPVNIDASLTSLSAGSLTTVARADHIHTLSKVPVLLASTTLGSSSANITWTSIPQTYASLQIVGNIAGTNASTYVIGKMRVNADSTLAYHCQSWEQDGSSYYSNADALYIGWVPAASNYWPKGGFINVILPNYTGSQHKVVSSIQMLNNSTTSTPSIYLGINVSLWNNTAAVTELSIFVSSGNLASGSTLQLYGLP